MGSDPAFVRDVGATTVKQVSGHSDVYTSTTLDNLGCCASFFGVDHRKSVVESVCDILKWCASGNESVWRHKQI